MRPCARSRPTGRSGSPRAATTTIDPTGRVPRVSARGQLCKRARRRKGVHRRSQPPSHGPHVASQAGGDSPPAIRTNTRSSIRSQSATRLDLPYPGRRRDQHELVRAPQSDARSVQVGRRTLAGGWSGAHRSNDRPVDIVAGERFNIGLFARPCAAALSGLHNPEGRGGTPGCRQARNEDDVPLAGPRPLRRAWGAVRAARSVLSTALTSIGGDKSDERPRREHRHRGSERRCGPGSSRRAAASP